MHVNQSAWITWTSANAVECYQGLIMCQTHFILDLDLSARKPPSRTESLKIDTESFQTVLLLSTHQVKLLTKEKKI